jgi:hypothetical protein
MSAEIIDFVPRPRGHVLRENQILFRSRAEPDDLVMDHADTAPCEYVPSPECNDDEPA